MSSQQIYTQKPKPLADRQRYREAFFKRAGASFRLFAEMMETLPEIALVVKDAKGRIVHMNAYNVRLAEWESLDEVVGYTSEELYPPELASVYAARDREVMETGVPIVNRIYGAVADRSGALNCITVRPVEDACGVRIGTATVYYRAQKRIGSAAWYNPVRKAINYLNAHLAEDVTVERLAEVAHYSVAQLRRHFHATTQMSPSEYLQHARLNAARTLLKTTDRLVADIAAETGFYDQSHFIHVFRRATGTTPARFRRDYRDT